jgi:hypothetical protein
LNPNQASSRHASFQRESNLRGYRVLLILISLSVPLLVLELALRTAGPIVPGDYQTASFTEPSSAFGLENRPNGAGWKKTSEFATHVRVNSKGLRGPEAEYAKPPDTFRILILGDSFTFALQVDEEQTFVRQLGEDLQVANTDLHIETINAGADGWNTLNELAWLTAEGYRYNPDLVLLMYFVGNDPGENADAVGEAEALDRLLPTEDDVVRRTRVALSETFATYNLFEYGVLAKLTDPLMDAEPHERPSRDRADPGRKERGWEISAGLLERFHDFQVEREIDVMVVGIPTVELMSNPDRPATPLRDISQRAGLPVIDLLDPFRDAPEEQRERLYFEKNRHWTGDGHDLAARVVAAELQRLRLVPTSPIAPEPSVP